MTLLSILAVAALLGSAVIGGIFFAFSSFIMKALARLPPAEGIRAMQSINVVVLNPVFLSVFMGTGVLSLAALALALMQPVSGATAWYLAGTISYIGGTFLLTGVGNVPLNNRLAVVAADEQQATAVWYLYLGRWTRLNTVRTAAAILAAMAFLSGLLQS